MKFGVVVFPGSNCDHDAFYAIGHVLHKPVEFIWHQSEELANCDAIILPGGFAFGDYLRTGAIARFSPVMKSVEKFAKSGGMVLGICNGFQILLEAGLLPGAMMRNVGLRYICRHVHIRVEQTSTPFTSAAKQGQVLKIPIAHNDGNYNCDEATLVELEKNRQVVFRYTTPEGSDDAAGNPNGSMNNIAGICNRERNVAGLMPHPERAVESALDSADGLVIFQSMVEALVGTAEATAPTEIKVTPEIAAEHGLTAQEYARVKQILGREPNITELGIFSVMWSEHCSYKSSKVHLKRLPTRGKLVVQGPGENAGVVDIGDGLVAAFKIESHNHPSYVEPFQGATTGVGGILRDIFTMGARPIAVLDSLRFGPITDDGFVGAQHAAPHLDNVDPSAPAAAQRRNPASPAVAAANRRILDGVIRGVANYGNCFGVPTVGGEVCFEPCYSQNPLVNALALGIAKKEDLFFAKARGTGNPVIYVGAKTGRDGIHGASLLASAEFTEESKQKRPNVQVGDPFLEKLLLEACIEAMQTGAVVAIQDMGAAGLTCSTTEMASRGGTGIEIDLAKVPQRETDMTPYEIMLSESQERMLLVAEKGRESEVLNVFAKWGLDAVVVGEVKEGGLLCVKDHGKVAAEIPAHPLAEEGPVYQRPIAQPPLRKETPADWFVFAPEGTDLTKNFAKLLASPAIASKRWITEQYDTMVRTNTLAVPGASDAAVVRIKGTKRALALATDGNGRWCQLNPRLGAMHAVAEAARNVAASGARPIAATNCLNFGSPEKPEVMWQFSEAIDGLTVACNELGTPITGGNVSFYNETLGNSIYPTPVIGILGVIDDASHLLKIAFREEGDIIVLLDGLPVGAQLVYPELRRAAPQLGDHPDARLAQEFSSSEYSKTIGGIVVGQPPPIDLDAENRLIKFLGAAAAEGLVQSAHDISDGGLAVTLAESCFAAAPSTVGARHAAPALGATVNLDNDFAPNEYALFGEQGARAIVSVQPSTLAHLLESARQSGVAAHHIGQVTRNGAFRILLKGRVAIDSPVETLRDAWANSLERALKVK